MATITVDTAPTRFDLGQVIAAGFGLLARRPLTLLVLAVLLALLPAIAAAWAGAHLVPPAAAPSSPDYLAALLNRLGVLQAVSFATTSVNWTFQAGVALCALDDANHRFDNRDLAARLLGRTPWIVAIGAVTTVAVPLGTLALIVPGLIMALAWCTLPAVTGAERLGFAGAFRRSAELTRGHRGALLGMLLIYGLLRSIVTFGLRFLSGTPTPLVANTGSWQLLLVVQPVISAVLSTIYAAVMAATYLQLRALKDGVMTGHLAATFD